MFKNLFKLLLVTLIGMGFVSISVSADVAKGQKIILKKLKKSCGMNGAELSKKHTQSEWKAVNDKEDGLNSELQTICPKLKKPLKKKYVKHVYDFLYNYASDSGNVPSC